MPQRTFLFLTLTILLLILRLVRLPFLIHLNPRGFSEKYHYFFIIYLFLINRFGLKRDAATRVVPQLNGFLSRFVLNSSDWLAYPFPEWWILYSLSGKLDVIPSTSSSMFFASSFISFSSTFSSVSSSSSSLATSFMFSNELLNSFFLPPKNMRHFTFHRPE